MVRAIRPVLVAREVRKASMSCRVGMVACEATWGGMLERDQVYHEMSYLFGVVIGLANDLLVRKCRDFKLKPG